MGIAHLNHLSKGTFATAAEPIVQPKAGEIIFVKPSPYWNAETANCGSIPKALVTGSIIGINMAALLEAEGIIGFINAIILVIPMAERPRFKFIIGLVNAYTIV